MFAVEGLAGHRGFDAFQRVERGDGPIGTKRQRRAGIEQRAEGISALGALRADAFLAPTAVVSLVIRLHRGDHLLLTEPRDFARAQVLGVFDSKATVALAISLAHLLINI